MKNTPKQKKNKSSKKSLLPDDDTVAQMFESMFAMFKTLHPGISQDLTQKLLDCCKIKAFKKNEILVKEDGLCDYCYFAAKGLVKAVFTNKAGQEKIAWFMCEGDIIISVKSFYSRKASNETLKAMEKTWCIALHWDDLQAIYKEFIEFNIIGRRLTEHYYCQAIERTKWVHLDAAERYAALVTEYPSFIKRIPDADMAAYLGINKTFFSLIKTEYHKKDSQQKDKQNGTDQGNTNTLAQNSSAQ